MSKIAAGAIASGGSGAMGVAGYTSKDIEVAMADAVTKAHADGITSPVEVLALMMAARRDITKSR